MRGERVVTSWPSVSDSHDTVLVNLCSMLWPATELSVKGVRSLTKRKKKRYPQGLILRIFLEWNLPISWWILKNQEHIFSVKIGAASLNLISPLSLLKYQSSITSGPAIIYHQGWGGRRLFPSFLRGSHNVFSGSGGGISRGQQGLKEGLEEIES